jgi:putative ABC transport system substrate-binding protein
MNRRDAVFSLIALGATPLLAQAQPAKPFRIAYMSFTSPETVGYMVDAFKQGLRDLGYVEGKNVVFDVRWAMGKSENLPGLAQELVALKPDVILAGSSVTARPFLRATTTIPIVGTTIMDPVGNGLIKSLARSGDNFTGRASLGEEMSGQQLELLLAVTPKSSKIAILWNPLNPSATVTANNLLAAAKSRGVRAILIGVKTPAEIDDGFARMAQEAVRGFIGLQDALLLLQRHQIAELALRYRMASILGAKDVVKAGGLISYGVNYAEEYKRAAVYVDKILKGAKPSDLPIEQAMIFELVVNLKTAKALGIKIPQSVLLRADEVIE